MKNPSKRITWKEISRQKFLMVCAAIFFVYGIVFYYVPLAGWVMAFQDYKPKDGLFGSKFVGLQKFKFLFSDDVFLRDIRNTLAMGVLNLVTTFLMAIIFAILLNEVRNMFGKKLVQTVSYLPHFLSWIVVTGILHDALSSTGIINETAGEPGHSEFAHQLLRQSGLFLANRCICQCLEGNRLECHCLPGRHYLHRSQPV